MSATIRSTPLQAEDFYHTGVVVDDIDQAKAELGAALGLTWGLQGEVDMPTILADGLHTLHMRFAYSVEGPPYLELVQAVEGTIYTVAAGGGAHHVGYWCADMEGTAAQLEAQGMTRVATVGVQSIKEQAHWIIYRSASGLYIELVDEALRAGFEAGEAPSFG
jgi:hypothetical protein